jgi:hypothetical protein
MTRALIAVGAGLALSFLVLGLVVYVNREKESVAVDSGLAERISRAITVSRESGDAVDLAEIARFGWDRVLIAPRRTPRQEIERALGIEFKGDLPYDAESLAIFVFARGGELARFADYRGLTPFAELPLELARDEALLHVENARVRAGAP